MFFFLAVLTSFSALTMLVAGCLSLLRNSSKLEHRWFFVLTVAMAIWVPANFFDSNVVKQSITLPLLKIDYSTALLITWCILGFMIALLQSGTVSSQSHKKYLASKKRFLITSAVVNALFITAIYTDKLYNAHIAKGKLVIDTHDLFIAYVAILGYYTTYAFTALGRAYIHSSDRRRQGLDLIWIGFFFLVVTNVATNLIFPSVISNHQLVKELNIIGYAGFVFLVITVYVAITVRKLFDIRLVVARSLAYTLLLLSVASVYAGATILISVYVSGSRISTLLLITSTVLTFLAAVTFEYIRTFFTRVTNHIFFRENYESQLVLSGISNITTSTLNVGVLMRKTIVELERVLKSAFCSFVILDEQGQQRVFNFSNASPHLGPLYGPVEASIKPHDIVMIDYVDTHSPLKKVMSQLGVDLVIPLHVNGRLVGYMVFGAKQSGAIYSQQDMQLLTIVADSLALATQNALRFEEIENFNLTLQAKINDATRKLRRSNEKLKELDEAKDDFISMASHQLRTPLTSVKGYLSMILDEDAGKVSAVQRRMLGQAFFSSQRMVFLIADLLNVSRIKSGKFMIEPSRINLANMVQQEMQQLEETAASRSLSLRFEKPADFPDLMIDETKIRQVVMNFIDNAIYYTPAGGHIAIRLIDNPATIELRVEDDGIGVPKAEQHHLFTKFYRAGNARKARPDGTGLGLFMAKKVIIAQGGSTIFESQEGKGSTFGFIFSKSRLALSHKDQVQTATLPEVAKKDLAKVV